MPIACAIGTPDMLTRGYLRAQRFDLLIFAHATVDDSMGLKKSRPPGRGFASATFPHVPNFRETVPIKSQTTLVLLGNKVTPVGFR